MAIFDFKAGLDRLVYDFLISIHTINRIRYHPAV